MALANTARLPSLHEKAMKSIGNWSIANPCFAVESICSANFARRRSNLDLKIPPGPDKDLQGSIQKLTLIEDQQGSTENRYE